MPAPIKGNHYITQGYGATPFAKSPTGQRIYRNFGGIHTGYDFGTHHKHLPVISTCEGVVVRAKSDGGWGLHVEVKGNDGWNRQYAHLNDIHVKEGDKVEIGACLGTVGTTGASTGIHLHYGHRRLGTWRWEYRDPTFELNQKVEKSIPKNYRLVKGKSSPNIYFFTGETLHRIPNMRTLALLFPKTTFKTIGDDIISKTPKGGDLTDLS